MKRSVMHSALALCAMIPISSLAFAGPDLVVLVSGFVVRTQTFSSTSGSVLDGCITPGTHRVLRFNFRTWNNGTADLILGSPESRPDLFVFSQGHDHYHLPDFNQFLMLDSVSLDAIPGAKQAFCLMDSQRIDPNAPSTARYTCENQGVQRGWADLYASNLSCQFVPIDGLPDGTYRLISTTNARRTVMEEIFTNNSTSTVLRIAGDTVTLGSADWNAWQNLPGQTAQQRIAAVSRQPNQHELFVRGADNALWHIEWNGSVWSSWQSLGGALTSDPVVVSAKPDRLDVFARGADNSLQHIRWNGQWGSWTNLGGVMDSEPAVALRPQGQIDVFARTGSVLNQIGWNGTAWSAWRNLGGNLAGTPVAISRRQDRINVFVQDAANRLAQIVFNGSTWGSWQDLGGSVKGTPAVAAQSPSRLDVVVRATDDTLRHISFNGSWSSWANLGGTLSSSPALVAWGPNHLDVFAKGTDNAIKQIALNGTTWSAWRDIAGSSASSDLDYFPGTALSWAQNRLDLFVRQNDGSIALRTFF